MQNLLFVENIENVNFKYQREWDCFVHFPHNIAGLQAKLLKIAMRR